MQVIQIIKKIKTPLILLLVLLAVGGVAMWDDWRTEKQAEEEKTSKSLTSLKAEEITKIVYRDVGISSEQQAGEQSPSATKGTDDNTGEAKTTELTLAKIDGRWRVTAPLAARADTAEVEDFIRTVLDYRYDRVISDPSSQDNLDLAEYGLDQPRRTIILAGDATDGAATSLTLRLGDKSPVGYSAYFSTDDGDDGKVYIGSQYILTSTAKSLFSFRAKELVALDRENIKSISFWHQDKKHSYVVERKDSEFQLQQPAAFTTSQSKVREFIDEFNRVRVEKFFDNPAAALVDKFSSAKALVMTAVFELSTGETKSLSFVRDRGNLLVAFDASKVVFKIPALFEETVNNLSANFRDHRVFAFKSADIEQVEVDGEIYRHVEGKWYRNANVNDDSVKLKLRNPEASAHTNIQVLLDEWETAEALGFAAKAEANAITSKGAAHKVVLTVRTQASDAEGEQPATTTSSKQLVVMIWQHDDEKFYLKHDDSEELFIIAKSMLDSIATTDTSILTTE
ncbi:MAG: DUF4340 domain-containing protein [Pseudomonadota bacterium]|nr:DUF4340 domain-containing protein [Pseudomonadota bacterium]